MSKFKRSILGTASRLSRVVLIWCICFGGSSLSIIVDGDKKLSLSASKHQKHDEKSMIDGYNVKTCGISDFNTKEHEFVNMAREGQFPWIVSFQIKLSDEVPNQSNTLRKLKEGENLHFCGGSFISDKWILSAAHCFQDRYV